jgi:small subunit ribosomal protein S17
MADETEERAEDDAVPHDAPEVLSEAEPTDEPDGTAHDVASATEPAAEVPAAEVPAAEADAAEPDVAVSVPVAKAKVAEPPVEDGERPNRRKVREGVVVSDAMQSTVVVAVVERVRHPRYGKTVQRTKKLYVHDAEDTAKVGDRVRVQETRPLSKLKRWRLTEVVERAR